MGDYIGDYCRVIKGDTRSLNYSSGSHVAEDNECIEWVIAPYSNCP